MLKLELNFDKKDIEVEINGKIYGFDLNNEKLEQMASLKEIADNLDSNNETEVIEALEDGLELIYGEGTIDSIYGNKETTRATLLDILFLTIKAIENYGGKFGINMKNSEDEKKADDNVIKLNRQQRRAQRRANNRKK
ncbi:hypothetical protein HMPREF9709_01187 [Helcococcus kunzii ATCC 51366]|uniref:Phage protein n=1 Tax=Helcococcus kunzii ATCC 51366 TaxID=883114 RepID=H3NPC6_9FIRM|nr:hypothetical protein [Helcococcus kunzii]EHR33439.1 hypothetical protein HMPREF9709_01187 [Helcococcus kunzii ATCC 51366]